MRSFLRRSFSFMLFLILTFSSIFPLCVSASSPTDYISFAYRGGTSFSSAVVLRTSDFALVYTAYVNDSSVSSITVKMNSGKSYSATRLTNISNIFSVWKCTDSSILKETGTFDPGIAKADESITIYTQEFFDAKKISTSFTGIYEANDSRCLMRINDAVSTSYHPWPVLNSRGELVALLIGEDIVYSDWFSEQLFKESNQPVYTMANFKVSYGTDQYRAGFWGQNKVKRNQVKHIVFQNSLPSSSVDAWDVSSKQDRSVMAWLDSGTLYVGANGRISPNANASGLFSRFGSLLSIDFGGIFDTSNVTDMNHMFYWCDNLSCLDVSDFNTSKVTSMNGMFAGLVNMTNLDLSSFDTRAVTDMGLMFESDKKLTCLDLSNFNTDRVEAMNLMFGQCWSIQVLDISSFSSQSVKTMDRMFYGCTGIKSFICCDSKIQAKFKSK